MKGGKEVDDFPCTCVATAVPKRQEDCMFRMVGAALGTFITFALHIARDPAIGFMATFLACGLTLILAIPLTFLMPSGQR